MENKVYLEPCPFCGGNAYIAQQMNHLYIDCDHDKNCILTPNTWLISSRDLKEQIESWNNRYILNKNKKIEKILKKDRELTLKRMSQDYFGN